MVAFEEKYEVLINRSDIKRRQQNKSISKRFDLIFIWQIIIVARFCWTNQALPFHGHCAKLAAIFDFCLVFSCRVSYVLMIYSPTQRLQSILHTPTSHWLWHIHLYTRASVQFLPRLYCTLRWKAPSPSVTHSTHPPMARLLLHAPCWRTARARIYIRRHNKHSSSSSSSSPVRTPQTLSPSLIPHPGSFPWNSGLSGSLFVSLLNV